MGTTKYLMSMGELHRKDNSLCFRVNEKNIYLPIENIKELYILNEISLNSKTLDFLATNNVVVHFFNYYGNYSGTFYPKDKYISGRLLLAQVDAFKNKREKIAKAIILSIGNNAHEVIYHYFKHGNKEVKPFLDWVKTEFIEKLEYFESINELMSVEGELWQRFYGTFKYFLKEDFVMNKRVKRPPDNPINALISFGNSILYTKTISAIYRTHLNQSISFLHSPSESRFSLSLDICEAFKPIIVFKTIFDLVNNGRLKVEKHFESNLNYCILNEEGRQIFLKAFDNRIEEKFMNEKLKRYTTYRTQIKLDCYKLIKYILEDKEFKPYSLKLKQ